MTTTVAGQDGRYSWFGDAAGVTGGQIAFIGDPTDLINTVGLTWTILQRATDGSQPQLSYTTDGTTFTTVNLGSEGTFQQTINENGLIKVALTGATKLAFDVVSNGGTVTAGATPWVVTVAVTRNVNETLPWDSTNPFDPLAYNANPLDLNGQPTDTLLGLRTRVMIRLGFSNQASNPPPGMAALINDFISSGQMYLWRKYQALQTRRFFRWKLIPNQRYYSLLDNDEDPEAGFHLDPLKTIEWAGIQDTRNVWYPLIEGVEPQLYTMIDKPWRPARYSIRQALEVYPAPDQTYFMWLRGHVSLRPLAQDTDKTTIDSEMVFLHALATAKAHYGQADANNIEALANDYRGQLTAASHGTKRYVPGTQQVPPAVRPTLIGFNQPAGA